MSNDVNISVYIDKLFMSVESNSHNSRAQHLTKSRLSKTYYSNFVDHVIPDAQVADETSMAPLRALTDVVSGIYSRDIKLQKASGILPPGLLYIDENYLIFEKPPTYQNISLIPQLMDEINYDRHREILFRLPLPWQVYIVNFVDNKDEQYRSQLYTANVRMLFTNGPIQSFDDPVFLPPLNNLYTNGTLCRPMYNSMDDIERYSKDLAGVIESAYEWIWNSGTNMDLSNCIVQYYLQLRDNLFTDTLFSNIHESARVDYLHMAKCVNIHSYYCGFSYIEKLYSEWEKFTLEEVSSLRWPTPSQSRALHADLPSTDGELFMEYAREHGAVSDEDMHYDEDNDSYFQCGDSECHCMGDGSIDYNQFLTDTGRWPLPTVSLRESVHGFIRETLTPSSKYGAYFVENIATQLINDTYINYA